MLVLQRLIAGWLTTQRNSTKSTLESAIIRGKGDKNKLAPEHRDIVSISERLLSCLSTPGRDVRPTKAMCARIAFLRKVLTENPSDQTFWPKVDSELKQLREELSVSKQTKYFTKLLEEDRVQYPAVGSKHWVDRVEDSDPAFQEAEDLIHARADQS